LASFLICALYDGADVLGIDCEGMLGFLGGFDLELQAFKLFRGHCNDSAVG
jgi:hypothetical protein